MWNVNGTLLPYRTELSVNALDEFTISVPHIVGDGDSYKFDKFEVGTLIVKSKIINLIMTDKDLTIVAHYSKV